MGYKSVYKRILTSEEIESIYKMIKTKSDSICKIKNPTLGDVVLPYGTMGDIRNSKQPKGGYGFEHIIQKRLEINNLTSDQLTGLVFIVLEKVKTLKPDYWNYDRYLIDDKGIKIGIQKNIFSNDNTWIITAYPKKDDFAEKIKKEALDSIMSGIEQYGYLPMFSVIRTEIGALTSCINIIREKFDEINLTTLDSKTTKQH